MAIQELEPVAAWNTDSGPFLWESQMNCLETYECETRGCYAVDVGMSIFCPGVESRKAKMEKGEEEG